MFCALLMGLQYRMTHGCATLDGFWSGSTRTPAMVTAIARVFSLRKMTPSSLASAPSSATTQGRGMIADTWYGASLVFTLLPPLLFRHLQAYSRNSGAAFLHQHCDSCLLSIGACCKSQGFTEKHGRYLHTVEHISSGGEGLQQVCQPDVNAALFAPPPT